MDRSELDALMLAARKAAFEGAQLEALAAITAALDLTDDPTTRGELLLTRAVAHQVDDDPAHAAADALAAVEVLQGNGAWGLRASAAAIAAGFVLRAGDLEQAVDLAVESIVTLAEHEDDEASLEVLRASNALSVLFGRLAAFELAVDSAKRAWYSKIEEHEESVRSIVAYNLCSCGLERLRSPDCGQTEKETLIDLVREAIDYLCNGAPTETAKRIVGPGMRAELAILGHANPAAMEALARFEGDYAEVPPQVRAWHQLVRSIVAGRRGEVAIAADLLDEALTVLRLPAAEEHNLLRAMRERAEIRRLMGDMEGACNDLFAIVERLHRAQLEQVGRLSGQIRRRAEGEIQRALVRQEAADAAEQMSIDEVTGVSTRRWLERTITELADSEGDGAVIMLDLDRFKNINDTYGHSTGDRVLAEVGALLKESVRQGDMVARYGGEEFVVIMPSTSIEVGRRLGERIGDRMRSRNWGDLGIDQNQKVTMSAGVSAGALKDLGALLEIADKCLYEAKRTGRDRVIAHKLIAT